MKPSPAVQDAIGTTHAALAAWMRDLTSLLPHWITDLFMGEQTRIVLRATASGLVARSTDSNDQDRAEALWNTADQSWDSQEEISSLHRQASRRLVDLIVPADAILEQEVVLPRTALMNLEGAIAYGLSTWTPFSPEDVYFAAHVQSLKDHQATVLIRYALKERLSPIIAEASHAGLAPDRLIFDQHGTWATAIAPQKVRMLQRAQQIDAGLALTAVLLGAGLIGLILVQQSRDLQVLQQALRSNIETLRKDEQIERSLNELEARRTVVAVRRNTEPRVSEILTAIGNRLSPTAYVASLDIGPTQGRLEVAGASAAEILQALRGIAWLGDLKVDASSSGQPMTFVFTPRLARQP